MSFWIIKTEPGAYAFEDLAKDKTTAWDGVRNYQARNNLRLMKEGDLALVYHSVGPKELVGVAKVSREHYRDPTAKDGDWSAVDVTYHEKLPRPVSLAEIKNQPGLSNLSLIKQSRLSVCPVSAEEWAIIMHMSR